MTPSRKIVRLNLSILAALVAVAIIAYAVMQGSPGAQVFARGLHDPSAARRIEAATALQSFGSAGASAVPALLDVLQNPEEPAAPASARALREIDAQAAYEFVTGLIDRKAELTARVIDVLGNLGPVAWRAIPAMHAKLGRPEYIRALVPALIEAGDYSDDVIASIAEDARDPVYSAKKWNAMLAFDRLADLGDRIAPELERLTSDREPAVAGQARNTLAKIRNEPKYAQSGLAGFGGQRVSYQEYALDRLSKQGPRAADAIPDIVVELRSKTVLLRFMAAWTLMHIGPAARTAIPQLRAAESDPASLVRDGATDAIYAIEAAP